MEMVRYCPECDDEFRPEITVCSDCGGDLDLQEEGRGAKASRPSSSEGDDGDGGATGGSPLSLDAMPASSLLPVRTFDALGELEPVVAAFAAMAIPSRVVVQNGRYILLIRPDNLAVAQEALHSGDGDSGEAEPVASGFDPASGRYANCPACDASLAEDFNGACPECGLELTAPPTAVNVPEAE